jgi:hypothetical protein
MSRKASREKQGSDSDASASSAVRPSSAEDLSELRQWLAVRHALHPMQPVQMQAAGVIALLGRVSPATAVTIRLADLDWLVREGDLQKGVQNGTVLNARTN